MRIRVKLCLAAIGIIGLGVAACTTTPNTNENANARGNTNLATPRAEATPTPATGRGQYTEEQAREERAKAKEKKETIGQSLDDAWIHTKIVAKLIADPNTPERKINVDIVEGVVTLRGSVDSAEEKAEAERTAKETDGVKKVINQLKVAPAKPANTNKSANANKTKVIYE